MLLDKIIKVVTESNFKIICSVLESYDDLVEKVVLCYSIMSSITNMDSEEMNLDTLIYTLIEKNILTKKDNQKISKPNKKKNFIYILSLKPLDQLSNFLNYLDHEHLLPLLSKITKQMSQIKNDISYTKLNDFRSPKSVLEKYKEHLRHVYKALPILSKQGWTTTYNTDHFINVTVIKSLHQVGQNTEYSRSTNETLDNEIHNQYNQKVYTKYDDIFEGIDSENRHFILLEGNAGTGKTTLTYKFCREWAEGNVLLLYSHVILLRLREIKPSMINNPEDLFSIMGKTKDEIRSEMAESCGSYVLFWLEGWDELDDELKFNPVLTNLIRGELFPRATIVVSTRPSATSSLKEFLSNSTYRFKLVGFIQKQMKEYVQYYCASEPDPSMAETFMAQLEHVPCWAQLAEVPLNLAILLELFKKSNQESQDLPTTYTELFYDFVMNILQHHTEKKFRGRQLLNSVENLPPEMQKKFNAVIKYAFEHLFHCKPVTEDDLSDALFNSLGVPSSFDGFGMFRIGSCEKVTGKSKTYMFLYKPVQELLAVIYLTTLKAHEQLAELKEMFGNNTYEMLWVFYAGITKMKLITIDEILFEKFVPLRQQLITQLPSNKLEDLVTSWQQCRSYFNSMIASDKFSNDFLLTLIQCCYEAKNEEACEVISANIYPDYLCRIEIPPSRVSPYLLLAVSYFISHSGKMWSLRCDASLHDGVKLVTKYIINPKVSQLSVSGGLWVWCFVAKKPEIDAYCRTIELQSSLQWIHLLNGSCLGDEGTIKLCNSLTIHCSVLKIELEGCEIGSKGLKSIANMLNKSRNVLHIDIRKNHFLLEDILEFLHDIKTQMHLECLYLDKEYCENSAINSTLQEINTIRSKKHVKSLVIKF